MLQDFPTFVSFSVDDLEQAEQFYSQKLRLVAEIDPRSKTLVLSLKNGCRVMVYPKPDHVPATFTLLNFQVEDIERAVVDLRAAGVTCEQYDKNGIQTDAQGIATMGPIKMAWFKDPAGNVHGLIQGA